MTEPLVPLADIQSEAGWAVDLGDVEIHRDWADRPAVAATDAAELYRRTVVARNAAHRQHEARLEAQYRPVVTGVPAQEGVPPSSQ